MTNNFDYTEFADTAAGLWADLGDTYPGTVTEADVVRRLRDHLNTYPRIDDNQPAWAVIDSPEREAAERNIDLWTLRAAYIDAAVNAGRDVTANRAFHDATEALRDALRTDKDTP